MKTAPDIEVPNREAADRQASLAHVIQIGRRSYYEGMSFAKWAERLLVNHGRWVQPFLREAWREMPKSSTTPLDKVPGKATERNPVSVGAVKHWDWETFALGFSGGVAGGLIVALIVSHTFAGQHSGEAAVGRYHFETIGSLTVLRGDSVTGKAWGARIVPGGDLQWQPIKEPTGDTLQ